MIKNKTERTISVGGTSVTFTGRDPLRITDAVAKKNFLGIGIFTENEDGALFYSMPIVVKDIDGNDHDVGLDGYLDLDLGQLAEIHRPHFI